MERKQPEKKKRGRRYALVGGVLGILLLLPCVGCTTPLPTPTPDTEATEAAMARALEATMTALAPTVTNTPLPTDTLTPTDTPEPSMTPQPTRRATLTAVPTATLVPTATMTPTLAVQIPANWELYEYPTGEFTLWHPPEWPIRSEYTVGVALDLPSYGNILVGLVNEPLPFGVGQEDSVSWLVREVLEGRRGDQVKVLSKGSWTHPTIADYVEYQITKVDYSGYETVWHYLTTRMPADEGYYWYLSMWRIGTLSEHEINQWCIMLASIHLTPKPGELESH
ncbi:MAG TPA: hypothetical protein VMX14_11840 [Anaerolineae bacterium]|nr:hypothetical protein [Anaerolineae bacterium]